MPALKCLNLVIVICKPLFFNFCKLDKQLKLILTPSQKTNSNHRTVCKNTTGNFILSVIVKQMKNGLVETKLKMENPRFVVDLFLLF